LVSIEFLEPIFVLPFDNCARTLVVVRETGKVSFTKIKMKIFIWLSSNVFGFISKKTGCSIYLFEWQV